LSQDKQRGVSKRVDKDLARMTTMTPIRQVRQAAQGGRGAQLIGAGARATTGARQVKGRRMTAAANQAAARAEAGSSTTVRKNACWVLYGDHALMRTARTRRYIGSMAVDMQLISKSS